MKLSEVRGTLIEQFMGTPLGLPGDSRDRIDADLRGFVDLLALLYGIGEDEDAVREPISRCTQRVERFARLSRYGF